jgi:hypothetical protein
MSSRLSPERVIDYLRQTRAGDGNTGLHVLSRNPWPLPEVPR